MDNIEKVVKEIGCTGCGACVAQCPHNLISIKKIHGFFAAHLSDTQKCIQCQKCTSVCPKIHLSSNSEPIGYYYGWRKHDRNMSTSGGVATALSEYVISLGGTAIGCTLDLMNKELKHIAINKKADLYLIAKSKYAQSDTSELFSTIDRMILDDKPIVFIGTPCQVYGIRKRYGNKDNLILIDFVCHGVPSQDLFFDYITRLGGRRKITFFDFRSKKRGWNHSSVEYKNEYTTKIRPFMLDEYLYCFQKNISLGKACLECPFREHHFSDITVADCWNYHDFMDGITEEEIANGISSVITYTKAGEWLIKQCEEEIVLYQGDKTKYQYLLSQNCLPKNIKETRDQFYDIYDNLGYIGIKKKYFSCLPLRYLKERLSK